MGCPICRASAREIWLDENGVFLVQCEQCSTFTITPERRTAFAEAWRDHRRELLMFLELISCYLRLADDDGQRDVSADTWMHLAAEGENMLAEGGLDD